MSVEIIREIRNEVRKAHDDVDFLDTRIKKILELAEELSELEGEEVTAA